MKPTDETIITICTILEFMGKSPTVDKTSNAPETCSIQEVERVYRVYAEHLNKLRKDCE